ncbi:Solute carrier family 2, facilitated glucose transporter member 9 Glucose transporter type 9 [Channa argus]|uniref:Solute carrier family 2, facilitated glucose transporter member 5 n=1 Tax=Channa argus TaxID=215402 RepID=A0A6G1PH52_CHAAH|nr:Solute carrier family 2, facilitated glucose transporter member 9 Glucose transporter type 9 [Channa argus]KAK2914753.1 hypothetical protein Q8A73_005347 [Channa argus]
METLLQQLTRGNALVLIIILGMGGSFQAGYHITGISSPSPFIQRFINSSWYERYEEPPPPQMVTMIWSLIVSMYAFGALCGSGTVRLFSGMLGRKNALICNSLISIASGGIMLTSKRAKSYEMVIVSRMLYGYSAGVGLSIHLMYLGEISPKKIRGIVTLTSATFMSFGKLSGQFFGLSEILGREDLWNIILSVPVLFSVIQVIVLPFLPDAPRFLFIEKGDDKACKKALQSLWGQGDYKQEMEEMLAEQAAIEAAPPKSLLQLLRDRSVRWQLITISVICCCSQLSGMPAISIFSFDIFLKAGVPKDKICYIIVGLGLAEISSSICSGLQIDHKGRRPLFFGGYGALTVICVLITVTLNLKDSNYWVPYITSGLVVLFIICFCGGPAGATAALNSEIFLQSNRMAAFVFLGMHRWLLFAIVGLVFPFLINTLKAYSFVLCACMCLLGCLYTFFLLPETKGRTVLEISGDFNAITICGKSFAEEKSIETKL